MTDPNAAVPGAPSDNTTLTQVLDAFAADGFDGSMVVTDEARLRCTTCRTEHDPSSLEVDVWRRMEGASDPDDMLAVCGVVCPSCGSRASVVLNYGPEADGSDAEVLRALERFSG